MLASEPIDRRPGSEWAESLLVTLAGSAVMLALTHAAFDTYFFAENFTYLGLYRAHGERFWRAIFGAIQGVFFRPVLAAVSIPWHFVLPLDPVAYHWRNFGFCTVNLLLLHRVLLRLPTSRTARVVAAVFFAASKIHLVTIGYINLLDIAVLLGLLLLTVLFLLRWLDQQRPLDYGLMFAFCSLTIFSKDYGLVVIAVVAAILIARAAERGEWAALRTGAWQLAPLVAVTLLYLGVRLAVVGLPRSEDSFYAPRLSLPIVAQKLALFTSTIGNLSFFRDGTDGASGISTWLAEAVGLPHLAPFGEAVQYAALLGLLGTTFWVGRHAGWRLFVAAAWMAAFVAPTMLTRNLQIYYYQEPLAALALALALCWQRLGPRLQRLWVAALALIAVNGALGNPRLENHFAYCGARASGIVGPVLAAHRGEPLDSITFVADVVPFWTFTLVGERGTMLPELTGLPELKVRVIDRAALPARLPGADARNLFFDADDGFARVQPAAGPP